MAKKKPVKPQRRVFPLPSKEEIEETRTRIRLERKHHRTAAQRREDILRIHALQPELALRELAKEAGVSFIMVRMCMEVEDPWYLQHCLDTSDDWRSSGDWSRQKKK